MIIIIEGALPALQPREDRDLWQRLPPADQRGRRRRLEGELGLDEESSEDGGNVEVVLGTTFHVAVLPVAEHGGLRLLPGDLPLQVGLVAHHHHGHPLPSVQVHQVPQSGHLFETLQLRDAVDQQDSVGRGKGALQHGGELVHVVAAGVLDVQVQLDPLDVELSVVHLVHRLLVAEDEAVVEELRDNRRFSNLVKKKLVNLFSWMERFCDLVT